MFRTLIMIFSLLVTSTVLFGEEYPKLTEAQAAQFQDSLDKIISQAEKHVQEVQQNATRKDVAPTWNTKLELQNAIVQLEVKKTLVNNFKGTESLRSPSVRAKLIKTLNLPMITTADLADLQNLVLEEKAKIRLEDTKK